MMTTLTAINKVNKKLPKVFQSKANNLNFSPKWEDQGISIPRPSIRDPKAITVISNKDIDLKVNTIGSNYKA